MGEIGHRKGVLARHLIAYLWLLTVATYDPQIWVTVFRRCNVRQVPRKPERIKCQVQIDCVALCPLQVITQHPVDIGNVLDYRAKAKKIGVIGETFEGFQLIWVFKIDPGYQTLILSVASARPNTFCVPSTLAAACGFPETLVRVDFHVGASCRIRPSDFRSSQRADGISAFAACKLSCISLTPCPPGITATWAGWQSGNWNAASSIRILWDVQTRSIASTRLMMS